MKISKILKFISLSVFVMLLLFFWKKVVPFVVFKNLEVAQGNVLVLSFIYWLELISLLVIYDLVISKLHIGISYYLDELGQYAVRMKKVGIALYTIRLNYYLLRITRLLRLGWVTYSESEKSSVWIGLSKRSLVQLVLNIFRIMVSLPMLSALLFACFSLKILSRGITYYLFNIQEFLKEISKLKINISDIFSSLPALVALITIVPVIFFFYFYSQKRDVRKIIDKENSQYFEEVVLLYEKLLIWIDKHIYKLSENFDYVIKCQDSIVEAFLKKEVPNYTALVEKQYYISRKTKSFRFAEIADLTELQEIITKLSSDRLVKFTRIFSIKRFDIWHLYFWDFHSLRDERIERSFYTKKGMAFKISERLIYPYDFTKKEIAKKRKEELSILSWTIYNDLKLLYRLKRSSDSLRKYLYSSRAERMILKALKKDR